MAKVVDAYPSITGNDWKLVNFTELKLEIMREMAKYMGRYNEFPSGTRFGIELVCAMLGLSPYLLVRENEKQQERAGEIWELEVF